jgi:Arrestin (or S-antigen), C-terminal domain
MVSKGFTFSSGKLNLQVTLDRELFYHGEPIKINLSVKNESKKTVKSVTVSLFHNLKYLLTRIIRHHFQVSDLL